MIFYSSHCPKCKVLEQLMIKKNIPFTLIDNSEEYLPIADANQIMSMPFAEIDGKIYNTKELQNYINSVEVN